MITKDLYPSVYEVGKYLGRNEYYSQRLSVAQWVHNSELVKKVLNGQFYEIMPLHIEVELTSACNFNCSWCNCAYSRNKIGANRNLDLEQVRRIIAECEKNSIGIQWTGGEPLLSPYFCDAIKIATAKGLSQSVYSNGSLLDQQCIDAILSSNLKFIRISLNTYVTENHSCYHGNIDKIFSEKVFYNLNEICKQKIARGSFVGIGLSIVLDDRNICCFYETLDKIKILAREYPQAINFIIVRPVNIDIKHTEYTLTKEFHKEYSAKKNSEYKALFKEIGIDLVFPQDEGIVKPKEQRIIGCSTFSEISPDGDVFMCSDKYGDKDYKIGNIFEFDLQTIWLSSNRMHMIDKHKKCYLNGGCPRNSRGNYFNSIFNQIAQMQMKNEHVHIARWINALQSFIPDIGHTFFI